MSATWLLIFNLVVSTTFAAEISNVLELNKKLGVTVGAKVSNGKPCGPNFKEDSHKANPYPKFAGDVVYTCSRIEKNIPVESIAVTVNKSVVTVINAFANTSSEGGNFVDSLAKDTVELEAKYPILKTAQKQVDGHSLFYLWRTNDVLNELDVWVKESVIMFGGFLDGLCSSNLYKNSTPDSPQGKLCK